MPGTRHGAAGVLSEQRREQLRLQVSREAARLFWQQGVAATSGQQIADAVGLSVRTIWRHFRSKESCAEPIVARGVAGLSAMLRSWPRESSLEDHFEAELTKRSHAPDPDRAVDDLRSVQMIELATTEPVIRSAWLMACDQVESELTPIIAARLERGADDLEVRMHAAAAAAVVRAVNEDVCRSLAAGEADHVDARDLSERLAHAVRVATGGAVGDALPA